jgi:lysophospholipase L1-like esterase
MHRRAQLVRLSLAALLGAAVIATAAPADATVTIGGNQMMVAVGDSITANGYPEVAGGLNAQINAQMTPVVAPGRALLVSGAHAVLASGAHAVVVPSSFKPTIRYVNSGIAGNESSNIAAAVTTRITQYNPDVVLLLIGINDALSGVSTADYQANVDSILSQTKAALPHVQFVIVSVLVFGEQWDSGPLRWGNCGSIDARIDAFNVALQSEATTWGATYVDVRSNILTWLSTNNTPEPGVCNGPFAGGGPHPTIPTSEVLVGSWLIGAFSVLP